MPALQKLAWVGLIGGIVVAGGMITFLLVFGSPSANEPNWWYTPVMTLLIMSGIFFYYGIFLYPSGKRTQLDEWTKEFLGRMAVDYKFDERDKSILNRAAWGQWVAVILSLFVLFMVLDSIYQAEGQIPIDFIGIIFTSLFIVSPVALSAGILIGYWRANRNG